MALPSEDAAILLGLASELEGNELSGPAVLSSLQSIATRLETIAAPDEAMLACTRNLQAIIQELERDVPRASSRAVGEWIRTLVVANPPRNGR